LIGCALLTFHSLDFDGGSFRIVAVGCSALVNAVVVGAGLKVGERQLQAVGRSEKTQKTRRPD